MQHFIARTNGRGASEVRFPLQDDDTRGIARGDRVLFYQVQGQGEAERGVFVAWGEVDRLGAEDDEGVAHLKTVVQLRRRVPFGDLRADPRRARDRAVQPVSADVFNLVLARARRS